MSFTVRPFAGEFAAIADLLNQINPEPITPEQLETLHARFPANGHRCRMVAVDASGALVGYGNVAHTDSMKQGQFWLTLVTAPGARRQGVASAVLAELELWARSHSGTYLETSVPDDNEVALTFSKGRGFGVTSVQFASSLDLTRFDEAPWSGVVEQVAGRGIRFFTLAEQPGEASLRKLYDLYKVTDLDSPGYLGTPAEQYPAYEDWHKEMFGQGLTLPEGLIIAADGDRWVGCTILQKTGNEGGLYTEYTGVLREYRGHQIALALKLLSIRFAKAYGAPYMTTKNDSTNGPMLAVNQKMGYTKVSGRAWLIKEL